MNKDYAFSGIPDKEFVRGEIPMTKEEIRTITISKMKINQFSNILDIGGGTGSIAIECALKAKKGRVFTIERNSKGIDLIKTNSGKFSVENLEIIHGMAPDDLPENIIFDAIVIGGSGGNMEKVLDYAYGHLKTGGMIVGNMITIENMYIFLEYCKKKLKNLDVSLISVSKGKFVGDVTMMIANNGVYVIAAEK